jgi:serine/threonine protein kinase
MATDTGSWVGLGLLGGRYEVTSQLGAGGMGLVYRARDRQLDRDVVVKAPRRAMLENPEFAGRFAREVRSLVRLSHPHIVKVIDVGEHDGFPFAIL